MSRRRIWSHAPSLAGHLNRATRPLALAAAVGAFAATTACADKKAEPKPATAVAITAPAVPAAPPLLPSDTAAIPRAKGDSANQVVYGMRAALAYGGVTKGTLRAEQAQVYDDGLRYVLRGVTVTLTDPQGVLRRTVTAPEGRYDVRRARVDLSGDVVSVSASGQRTATTKATIEIASKTP